MKLGKKHETSLDRLFLEKLELEDDIPKKLYLTDGHCPSVKNDGQTKPSNTGVLKIQGY